MSADKLLPDALVPVSTEWYELCERAAYADRITISGELAEAIVKAISADEMADQWGGVAREAAA